MCYHITVILPKKVNLGLIDPILTKYHMDFIPRESPKQILTIKPYVQSFSPIKRHCDCDTPLGVIKRQGGVLPENRMKKLLKNPQINETSLNQIIKEEKSRLENDPEIKQWHEFLLEILDHQDVWWLGWYLHWQDNPDVVKSEISVQKQEISKDLLLNLEEDVLYFFQK